MVIFVSDEKPINAMYGSKMKLNLDKVKNNSNEDKVDESKPVEEVVEETTKEVNNTENVEKEDDKKVEEEVEKTPESAEKETPVKQENVKTESITENNPQIEQLKKQLEEKESKLSNQSNELNYLTNKVIPKLKKENTELNRVNNELSNALENSTKKYFDQLDINADLSDKIGKLGADGAVSKVRADKLESQLDTIKEDLQAEVDKYKDQLKSLNVDDLKNKNKTLTERIETLNKQLDDSKHENISLSSEVKKLQAELIEIGGYKEEVDKNYKQEITAFKEEIKSLKTQLKLKESNYDKLSNESKRTISELNNQVSKLEEQLEKESNKGLFNRFK